MADEPIEEHVEDTSPTSVVATVADESTTSAVPTVASLDDEPADPIGEDSFEDESTNSVVPNSTAPADESCDPIEEPCDPIEEHFAEDEPKTSVVSPLTTPTDAPGDPIEEQVVEDESSASDVPNVASVEDEREEHVVENELNTSVVTNAASLEDESSVVQTITTMETSQLCVHPVHNHSFSRVNFLLSGSMRTCAGCNKRLKAVLIGATNEQVVRCLACGAYAHRSCAMKQPPVTLDDWSQSMWTTKCSVNSPQLEESIGENGDTADASDEEHQEHSEEKARADDEVDKNEEDKMESAKGVTSEPTIDATISELENSQTNRRGLFRFLPPSMRLSRASVAQETDEKKESSTTKRKGETGLQAEETTAESPNLPPAATEPEPTETQPEGNRDSQGKVDVETQTTKLNHNDDIDPPEMVWTPEGPPPHWASPQALSEIIQATAEEEKDDGDEEETMYSPMHIASHTFANVSSALQENIIAHFIRRPIIERKLTEDSTDAESSVSLMYPVDDETDDTVTESALKVEPPEEEEVGKNVDVKELLTEVDPKSPERQKSSLSKVASGTVQAVQGAHKAKQKIGFACVAGSIAGGVAGLVLAGPAGAVLGAKFGQTAGLVGAILEGSLTVGVFVAGVAAGGYTGNQIQLNQEKRILSIGEDGIKRKVLLVRPNIWIDPIWESICAEAHETAPVPARRAFGLLPSPEEREASIAKRERYLRDSDIVGTDETEIPTKDKVLLLVSRSLNDKQSLPGHVYRTLIQKHRERCEERNDSACSATGVPDETETTATGDTTTIAASVTDLHASNDAIEKTETLDNASSADKDEKEAIVDSSIIDTGPDNNPDLIEDDPAKAETVADPCTAASRNEAMEAEQERTEESLKALRARRHDTHAVIKHVTATLLDVRPGFASSPAITELSATAVEGLVFGELYDSVFEEIVEETRAADKALIEKIDAFEENHRETAASDACSVPIIEKNVYKPAVDALLMLPEAHSAVDKLGCCVRFLELISVHFSKMRKSAICADSLLKMVCQHIIAARVPSMNAEVVFLEEFARDEQLLRGKEGYALVTLQASLHFLNASTDFDKDIFEQDEAPETFE